MNYETAKARYERINPIRGWAGDVRPIGNRSKTNETIRANPQPDGSTSYAYRLYNTDCVEYYANGDIVLRTGGWRSLSTANFISSFSPCHASIAHNHLWCWLGGKAFIVPSTVENRQTGLRFRRSGSDAWEVFPVQAYRKMIDRTKVKTERQRFMPFINWATSFLKMSDGWIMHETRAEAVGLDLRMGSSYEPYQHVWYRGNFLPEIFEWAQDEAMYMKLLCNILRRNNAEAVDRLHVAGAVQFGENMRFRYDAAKRIMYKAVEDHFPVHKLVPVEYGASPLRDVGPV